MFVQHPCRKNTFRWTPDSIIWRNAVMMTSYNMNMTSSEVILDKKYWCNHIVEAGDLRNIYFRNRAWASTKIAWSNVFLGHFYGRIWRNPVTMTSYNVNMTSSEVILDKKYWYNHIIETRDLRNVFFRDERWTNMKIEGSDFFLGHFYGKLWRNAILMNYHDVISAMTSLWHFCGNRRYQQTSYFGSGGGELHH